MKISYIAVAQIPSRAAQSIQVMRMAQAFAGLGHSVTLIVPTVPGREDVYRYYGVEPSFGIKRVRRLRLKDLGLLLWGFQAAIVARRSKPALVYGRQVHGCFFAALLGLSVILEIHEPPITPLSRRLLRRLIAMPRFVRLVTNSAALKELLRAEYDVPANKMMAAPNGAEDPGNISSSVPHNGDRLQVGYVGHLYSGRGVGLILDMARACPWADFHLVGGCEEDIGSWRTRSEDLRNVTFHGFVPPSSAERHRQACDVLLAPYQRETLTKSMRNQTGYMSPLKLFEYMASGKAILCSDLPVLREVVSDGRTAILCDPDKLEEWTEALERLREDPELRRSLGSSARAVFLCDFTRDARASKILSGIPVEDASHDGNSMTTTDWADARRSE